MKLCSTYTEARALLFLKNNIFCFFTDKYSFYKLKDNPSQNWSKRQIPFTVTPIHPRFSSGKVYNRTRELVKYERYMKSWPQQYITRPEQGVSNPLSKQGARLYVREDGSSRGKVSPEYLITVKYYLLVCSCFSTFLIQGEGLTGSEYNTRVWDLFLL